MKPCTPTLARTLAAVIAPALVAITLAAASAPTRAALAADRIDLPGDRPPIFTGTPLHESPLAPYILEGVGLEMEGADIDVSLVSGAKATAGDCLGVKVSAGRFVLDFGPSTFHVGTDGVELELAIDHIELSTIKIETKSWASACQWTGTFEVGGSASDVRLVLRFAPRIRVDDCALVSLGSFEARVSIGNLNLKPLQNDIDALLKNIVEDSITNALNLMGPGLLENALSNALLVGICQTKLFLYKAYMEAMFGAAELYSFPEDLVGKLQPRFPGVDVSAVRFGYRWQPQGNNTTDCSRIYFSDPGTVARLRLGLDLSPDEWNLVFHEMRHTEQCVSLGGRDEYAKRWFRDLSIALVMTALTDPVSYVWQLHDNMPMEEDATARSGEVVVVHGSVRDGATGQPVPGVEVSAFPAGTPVGALRDFPLGVVGHGGPEPSGSDVTSAGGRGQVPAGRYYFFLEPGTYDLYVRPAGSFIRKLAKAGFAVEAWDLAVTQNVVLGPGGEPQQDPAPQAAFRRGDSDSSGDVNITDALFTLGWLFADGPAPSCRKAADSNDDGKVDISDPLATLGYLFLGTSEPPPPFAAPGVDPTPDGLECEPNLQ
ncbi:MAG: hypothetical protein HY721_10795 [Planctomycetes bacterium]|nr:hypothetical protein [Planctomycetota bacterium]